MINELYVALANKTVGFSANQVLNYPQDFTKVDDAVTNNVRTLLLPNIDSDVAVVACAMLNHPLVLQEVPQSWGTGVSGSGWEVIGGDLIISGQGLPYVRPNTRVVVQYDTPKVVSISIGSTIHIVSYTNANGILSINWPSNIVIGDIALDADFTEGSSVTITSPAIYDFDSVAATLSASNNVESLLITYDLLTAFVNESLASDKIAIVGLALYRAFKSKN